MPPLPAQILKPSESCCELHLAHKLDEPLLTNGNSGKLENKAQQVGVSRETLLNQLAEEYEIDVDTIVRLSKEDAVAKMFRQIAEARPASAGEISP